MLELTSKIEFWSCVVNFIGSFKAVIVVLGFAEVAYNSKLVLHFQCHFFDKASLSDIARVVLVFSDEGGVFRLYN